MVTEVDSGSHSIIFALSVCYLLHSESNSVKNLNPRLSVLRNKAENIRNRSNICQHILLKKTITEHHK